MDQMIDDFPDGGHRAFDDQPPAAMSRLDLQSLEKALLVKLDEVLLDLDHPACNGGRIEIVTREARRWVIRHDTAHVLAQAVRTVPGTQVTIGPNVEDGLYDFARDERSRWKTWLESKPACARLSIATKITCEVVDATPRSPISRPGRDLQGRDHRRRSPGDAGISSGAWKRPVPLHLPSTHTSGKAFKLTKLAGGLLARRPEQRPAWRIPTAGSSDADHEAYLVSKRLKSATTAAWGGDGPHIRKGRGTNLTGTPRLDAVAFYGLYRRRMEAEDYVGSRRRRFSMLAGAGRSQDKFRANMTLFCETDDGEVLAVNELYNHLQKIFNPANAPIASCRSAWPIRRLHRNARNRCTDHALRHNKTATLHLLHQTRSRPSRGLRRFDLGLRRPPGRAGFDEAGAASRPASRVDEVWDVAGIRSNALAAGSRSAPNEEEHAAGCLRDAIGRTWQVRRCSSTTSCPAAGCVVRWRGWSKAPAGQLHQRAGTVGSAGAVLDVLIMAPRPFPLWLKPVQVVATITYLSADDYAPAAAGRLKRGPARRGIPAQREDQLQIRETQPGQG